MKKGFDDTPSLFSRCAVEEGAFAIELAETWSDDQWDIDQENRALEDQIISEGVAEGIIIGCNFWNLLQGL